MPSVAINAQVVFSAEIRRARQLGYKLQVSISHGVAYARLVPETTKAKAVCAAKGSPAIEGRCAFESDTEQLDALRLAIEHALVFAADAAL